MTDKYSVSDLKKLKVDEVREIALGMSVDTDGLTKPELIKAILNKQETSTEE